MARDLSPADDRQKWDDRYREHDFDPERQPTEFLRQTTATLTAGRALCLAAGAGRNAVHLATEGWSVTATDISPAGLQWCRQLASEKGVEVETVEADLSDWRLGDDQWDLVTMVSYLQPDLFADIRRSLRPGGHFLLHTFSPGQLQLGWGPRGAAHLADPAVIRQALAGWHLVHFEEGVFERPDGRREAVLRVLARRA